MKKVPNRKFQKIFRAIVLCGVLTGLLFSCGEGIRLFPFPFAETAKSDLSNLNFENKLPYQINILRLEDGQKKFKTKSRHNDQHQFPIESGFRNDAALQFSETPLFLSFSSAAEQLKLPFFSESGDSRAPPFTV